MLYWDDCLNKINVFLHSSTSMHLPSSVIYSLSMYLDIVLSSILRMHKFIFKVRDNLLNHFVYDFMTNLYFFLVLYIFPSMLTIKKNRVYGVEPSFKKDPFGPNIYFAFSSI